jgi:hypothetical protein
MGAQAQRVDEEYSGTMLIDEVSDLHELKNIMSDPAHDQTAAERMKPLKLML